MRSRKGKSGLPAFSLAISSIVFPSILVWSSPIEVMIDKVGRVMTLVASNLPPRPVSKTTTSTLLASKYENASAVVISKKVAGI